MGANHAVRFSGTSVRINLKKMKHMILAAVNKALGLVDLHISRKSNRSSTKPLIAGMEGSIARKFFWVSVYFETKSLEGSIAEFGVANGRGLAFWLNLKKQFADGCKLWALFSFLKFQETAIRK